MTVCTEYRTPVAYGSVDGGPIVRPRILHWSYHCRTVGYAHTRVPAHYRCTSRRRTTATLVYTSVLCLDGN